MDSTRTKGGYSSAYKLSKTGDSKQARLRRRSVEWKENRQDEVNRRRKVADLSPVQEGDVTRNSSYKDKTPVKGKGKNEASAPKVQDRLEMLKKWKAERELKKKQEAQTKVNKPVFKTGRTNVHQNDQRLFRSDHKVKARPCPIPVVKPAVNKKTEKPVMKKPDKDRPTEPARKVEIKKEVTTRTTRSSRNTGTHPEPVKSKSIKVQPSESSRPTRQMTAPPTRTTRSVSATRKPEKTTNGRITRQGTKGKVSAVVEEKIPEKESPETKASIPRKPAQMDSINTTRGSSSFAPPEFTFSAPSNLSSFIFKPLSPASAASFLCPNQESTSFMGTSPKRCSTPKESKTRKMSTEEETKDTAETQAVDITTANVTVTDTTQLPDETVISDEKLGSASKTVMETSACDRTVVSTNESLKETVDNSAVEESVPRRSRRSVRRSINITQEISSNKKETEPGNENTEGPIRRSRRLSVKASESDETSASLNRSQTRSGRGTRRSTASVTESFRQTPKPVEVIEETEEENAVFISVTESPSKKVRRSSRRSLMMSQSEGTKSDNEENGTRESTPTKSRRSLRKSVLKSNQENTDSELESPSKRQRTCEPETEKTEEKELTSDSNSDAFEKMTNTKGETKTPQEKRKRARKSFHGFAQPDVNSVVLSAKRKPRRSYMPKSPEEWVQVLSNSPMVEMTRRKPKIIPGDVPAFDLDSMDFEEAAVSVVGNSNTPDEPSSVSSVACDTVEPVPSTSSSTAVGHDATPATSTQTKTDEADVIQVTEISSTQDGPLPVMEECGSETHDVQYFRNLLVSETARLNALGDYWTEVNDSTDLEEEVCGQIRSTVGQAQLLIRQRFKQFSGLVDNCEFGSGEKETTCTDLQGFWDMIYFQVEDVDAKFDKLTKLKENNWVEDKPKPVPKKVKKKTATLTAKPAVKSKFAEFRAKMKQTKKEEEPPKPDVVEKVFDAGFFKVTSPVRKQKFHCEAGTPRKSLNVSPEEAETKSDSTPAIVENIDNGGSGAGSDHISLSVETTHLRATPARKSYVPIVPSPLLVDSTPKPHPERSCTRKTPLPKNLLGEMNQSEAASGPDKENKVQDSPRKTPKRRSIRVRKSVNFEDAPAVNCSDADFSRLLQPISHQEGDEENQNGLSFQNDSFSKYLQPTVNDLDSPQQNDSPRFRRGRASLKSCPSTEKRRSGRGVHFSPHCSSNKSTTSLPHTPYNRDSLVKGQRVRKTSGPVVSDDTSDSIASNLRSSRPSLLYTPPSHNRSRAVQDVPTATLISFSP